MNDVYGILGKIADYLKPCDKYCQCDMFNRQTV